MIRLFKPRFFSTTIDLAKIELWKTDFMVEFESRVAERAEFSNRTKDSGTEGFEEIEFNFG